MMAEPSYQFHPHRKPLPHLQPDRPYPSSTSPTTTAFSHRHTRTSSSSVFPAGAQPNQSTMYQTTFSSRRSPSTNTFSTIASTGNGPVPSRHTSTSTSNDLRRSTSSRSGGAAQQPAGYVALMRKQKATVWCDRAQHEDPRLVAQQRAAKVRAAMEVLGGRAPGRISTSGSGSIVGSNRMAAKIRHHGKAGLVGYTPAENFGVGIGGVPMRLSASEVEGGDDDDEMDAVMASYHHRSGSGRSSLGSQRRGLTYARQSGYSGNGRWSSGNTPPGERERIDSLTDLAEAGETPMPEGHIRDKDYFGGDGKGSSASLGNQSSGSGSSGERNDAVGELGTIDAARLASNNLLKSTIKREKSVGGADDLRRRGSVDERTATMKMGAGRLYIANPDADSD